MTKLQPTPKALKALAYGYNPSSDGRERNFRLNSPIFPLINIPWKKNNVGKTMP